MQFTISVPVVLIILSVMYVVQNHDCKNNFFFLNV